MGLGQECQIRKGKKFLITEEKKAGKNYLFNEEKNINFV